MSHTQEELTARLQENTTHSKKEKLAIINKEIPFQEGSRGLDPRVKEFLTTEADPHGRRPLEVDDLEITRKRVEVNNKDLSKGIHSETSEISMEGRKIPLNIYNRTSEKKPVLIYLHGGGFF